MNELIHRDDLKTNNNFEGHAVLMLPSVSVYQCIMVLNDFPFDVQLCKYIFTTMIYGSNQVILSAKNHSGFDNEVGGIENPGW